MKSVIKKFSLGVFIHLFAFGAMAQLKSTKDTIICGLYPEDRNEYEAPIENNGTDSISYFYELISENVTQQKDWSVEFCDCFECLIGLIDTGSCVIQVGEKFSFKYYVTLPDFFEEYTETYVTYQITNKNNPTNVDTFTFVTQKDPNAPEAPGLEDTTSILDLGNSNTPKFSVFPNPSNGLVSIHVETKVDSDVSIEIVNILGEKVLSIKETSNEQIFEKEYNVAELEKGFYFITVTNGDNVLTKRINIQ